MKNAKLLILSIAMAFILIGCGNNDGTTTSTPTNTDTIITAVDGYIKNAIVKDSTGLTATYLSNGKYIFSSTPVYPLTLTGGSLEDTNATFDINMTAESEVISPITTFLTNNSLVQSKFSQALSLSDSLDSFAVDYIDTNNSNLAKLSQLLYLILKDTNLTIKFKNSVENNNSLNSIDNIFKLAEEDINITIPQYKLNYAAFLTKVKTLDVSTSRYESILKELKLYLNKNLEQIIQDIESTTIYFDANSSDINTSQMLKITNLKAFLTILPINYTIKLEGNTDEITSDNDNFALGLRMATNVKQILIDNGTFQTINTVSYGKNNPVCSDNTEECKSLNRRVMINIILPN